MPNTMPITETCDSLDLLQPFMVMVNRKFMVKVEALSAYGAEHKILDDIYTGIQTAMAFSKEDMKGEYFINCMLDCQTISYEQLQSYAKNLETVKYMAENLRESVRTVDEEIQELRNRIEMLENDRREYVCKLECLQIDAEAENYTIGASREFGYGYVEV